MNDSDEVFDARIQLPSSIIVSGPSQSGKTEFTVNLLIHMKKLFYPVPQNIFWFYGTYTDVIDRLKKNKLIKIEFIEGIPENGFKHLMKNKDGSHSLYILDDVMTECTQNLEVTQLFCREGHHNNVSIILIMQDLFCSGTQRKTILKNAHYLCLFKSPLDMRSLFSIGQRIMPGFIREFLAIFEDATRKKHGYLFIDGKQTTPSNARLRTDIFGDFPKNYTLNNEQSKK